MMKDTLKLRGHLRIDKFDAAGQFVESVEAENLFLTTGINELWKLVTGQSANVFSNAQAQIGIGDSSTAALALADAATGADALTVDQGAAQIAQADSATGSESASLAAQLAGADAGSASDSLGVQGASTPADSAAGSEVLALSGALPASDSAAGSDAVALQVAVALADAGLGSDSLAIDNGSGATDVALADEARGFDALDLWVPSPFLDTTNIPIPPLVRRASPKTAGPLDQAAGRETFSLSAWLAQMDAAAGSSGIEIEKRDDDLELVALALAL